MVIEQTHSVTDSLNSVVPENLVGLCEVSRGCSEFVLVKRFLIVRILVRLEPVFRNFRRLASDSLLSSRGVALIYSSRWGEYTKKSWLPRRKSMVSLILCGRKSSERVIAIEKWTGMFLMPLLRSLALLSAD